MFWSLLSPGPVLLVGLVPGGGWRQLLRPEEADAGPEEDVVQPGALQEAPEGGAVVYP